MTKNPIQYCSFCSRPLQPLIHSEIPYIKAKATTNKTPSIICLTCLNEFSGLLSKDAAQSPRADVVKSSFSNIMSPQEIFSRLREHVVVNDSIESTLKDVALFAYLHIKRCNLAAEGVSTRQLPPRYNMLICSSSGTGKSHIFVTLGRILKIPYTIASAKNFSEIGFVGGDVEDICRSLVIAADGDLKKASMGVAIIDEIDKLSCKDKTNNHNVSTLGVQNMLLKMLDSNEFTDIAVNLSGDKRTSSKSNVVDMDVSTIGWAGIGAFNGLPSLLPVNNEQKTIGFRKDTSNIDENNYVYKTPSDAALVKELVSFGLINELVARLHIRSCMFPLNEDELARVLTEPKDSLLKKEYERFEREKITLSVAPELIRHLAHCAVKSGLNSRGIASGLFNVLKSEAFEHFGSPNPPVSITLGFKNDKCYARRYWLSDRGVEEKVYSNV